MIHHTHHTFLSMEGPRVGSRLTKILRLGSGQSSSLFHALECNIVASLKARRMKLVLAAVLGAASASKLRCRLGDGEYWSCDLQFVKVDQVMEPIIAPKPVVSKAWHGTYSGD